MERETRLILWNQFEILKTLRPEEAKEYEKKQEIISSGYTKEYSQIFMPVSSEEASAEMQAEVFDILDMFRALNSAERQGWVTSDKDSAKFVGFDGNNDDHYHFAQYLLDQQGLYQESSPNKNSHSSATIGRYRRMLKVWSAVAIKHELTSLEADQIVNA